MKTKVKESVIEKKVCAYARSKGWLTFKFMSPGCWGVPDRILLRKGVAVFIEFKSAGKRPTPLQAVVIGIIRAAGFGVWVVDNLTLGKELVDSWEC